MTARQLFPGFAVAALCACPALGHGRLLATQGPQDPDDPRRLEEAIR